MVDRLLVAIECRLCAAMFVMCLSCYRGHAYCSDECRGQSREEQNRRARAKYVKDLGPEKVREANKERKSRQRRSRQSEEQGDVTDQAPKVEGKPVGSEQLDRGSQGQNAAAEPGAGRAPDQAPEQASETIVDPGLSRAAEISSEPEGSAQAPRQPPPAAPIDGDMAVVTDEQVDGYATLVEDNGDGDPVAPTDEYADADLRWQPHPKAVPSRCSCCGKPGWLVPWVLGAKARPRSLRYLLAKGGPRDCWQGH